MFSSALDFLLFTVLGTLSTMFLLRFFMQYFKAPFANPLGQLVITLTDFAVKPARKVIGSWGKLDIATLLLALLTQALLQLAILWLHDFSFQAANSSSWIGLLGLSLLRMLRAILDLFFYAILLQVILSWVNPHSPNAPPLHMLTRSILAPIQRLIPVVNGIDFSPMVALLLLQMLSNYVMPSLETAIMPVFMSVNTSI